MSNPLHASFYADRAIRETVPLLENVRIACDTYRLRLPCRSLAARIVPGQFVMVRLADFQDPLLGRALALYDVVADDHGRPAGLDVVYIVKGKFTQRLARMQPGQRIDVWGPLGNGFPADATDHLVLVAGGIGQTPFLAVAKEYLGRHVYGEPPRAGARAGRVTLLYGARRGELLAGVEDFEASGMDVRLCTDDGSRGHHGPVTDLLRELLAETPPGGESPRIFCCGPEPMMEAVARITGQADVPCLVSLETPMACGVGICFTCVARVRDEQGQWDYKRTCVEGPVFDARRIVW